ncbi:MAG: iron-containing alcohol dehydrogenase [Erysipelotrichales bacterium]
MKLETTIQTQYDVHIVNNKYKEILKEYLVSDYILCLDSNVDLYYKHELEELKEKALGTIIIDASEENKNMHTIEQIHDKFHQYNATRKTQIISIGGGIVGDVVGFACSIYLRGIPYIQVPTTLLAQVDSSIGSKVGVNAYSNKNYIGSFYAPQTTIIDISFLKTLSTRLFKEGLVELIKHGLIKDNSIISLLDTFSNIASLRNDEDILLQLIKKSLKVKQFYVENDYHDLGLRNTLNYGHSFAHALELDTGTKLYHGECLAIGLLVNAKSNNDTYITIKKLFQRLELVKAFPQVNLDKIKKDKKQNNNYINEAFLNTIGDSYLEDVEANKLIDLYKANYTLLQKDYKLSKSSFEIENSSLSGTITIPPSKSQLHRYLLAASLSKTKTILTNVTSLSDDISITIDALKYLNTKVTYVKDTSTLVVEPCTHTDLSNTLNFKESGTSLRLLLPLLAPLGLIFEGENKLPLRPLDTYLDIFNKQNIEYKQDSLHNLPITINGELKPDTFNINNTKSSQFISGLLFILPLLNDDSKIICKETPSSLPYIKMSINTLKEFGINIEIEDDYKVYIVKGNQKYQSRSSYKIEQDYSSRAFFEVLNKFSNQNISISNKLTKSLQADYKIIDILNNNIKEVDLYDMPDAGPIMALYYSINGGKLINTQRLIHKESNRLDAIKSMLTNFNIDYKEIDNTIEIYPSIIKGNIQDTFNDHRITMSIVIGGTVAKGITNINEIKSINKSYPSFINDYKLLGGRIDEK